MSASTTVAAATRPTAVGSHARADPRLLPINYPRRAAEADDAAEVLLVDDADGAGAETQYVNVRKDQRAKRAKGPKRFDPLERGAVLD